MRFRIILSVTAFAVLGLVSSVAAAPRTSPSISPFSSAGAVAEWVKVEGDQAVSLTAGPTGFAGAELKHVSGEAPDEAPTFKFWTLAPAAQSGGSPRLVILFDDGGHIYSTPQSWSLIAETVGAGNVWDSNGPPCDYQYAATYEQALGCHEGADVTAAFLVTDSGWLNGAHTVFIDDITWGDTTIESAGSNGRNKS